MEKVESKLVQEIIAIYKELMEEDLKNEISL